MERKRPRRRRRRRPRRRTQEARRQTQATAPASDVTHSLLEEALKSSPADETELVWIGASTHRTGTWQQPREEHETRHATLFVRVLEGGRLGAFRTGAIDRGDAEHAIRQAIAQSRTRDTLQGLPHLPAVDGQSNGLDALLDPALIELSGREARSLLEGHLGAREVASLEWGEAEVLIFNSRGVRRETRVTHASLSVRCGKAPGAGRAAASSRSLDGLQMERVIERARRLHGSGAVRELPREKSPVVLAPEATIRLFAMLNQAAFTASAYHDGLSFLREHMGTQVFDRRINLCDDATDSSGLPFPFDLEGTTKRAVDLIVKGTPRTPALDQRQAALLGLPPTAHAVAGNDAQAQNLFLRPGGSSWQELLSRSDGGLFIGWLDRVECFDPLRVRFRAVARGVRRIEDGELGAPLPDLIWEDSLLRGLSNLLGLGSEQITWSWDGFAGAVTTPSMALAEVAGLREYPPAH